MRVRIGTLARVSVLLLLFALADAQTPTPAESKPTLGVAIDYIPETFSETLVRLETLGMEEVIVRLAELPTPEHWDALVQAAENSGLRWQLWLSNLPRADGWQVAPERYRMAGNPDGVYTIQIPDATRTLLAVSPRETPFLRLQTTLELSNGRAITAIGDTAESVLLLYPLRRNALPDLWDGWDAYRDTLLSLLQRRTPKTHFRGWIVQSDWDVLSLSAFPISPLAHAEWLAFLKTRYPDLTDLERAWDVSVKLERHEQAARLIPLWREGRGLPMLVALDGSVKPQELNSNRSRFWDDWQAFLLERWRGVLSGLRRALHTHTPNSEFLVLQTAPNPAELPTPEAFTDPQLPTGWLLPADQRDAWRTRLLIETQRRERIGVPLQTVLLEWAGDDTERASLFQTFARNMGIERIYWLVDAQRIPEAAWQALRQTDTLPDTPAFQPFPITMWGLTQIRQYRSGWWLPSEQSDLQPLLWGFEIHGFQRGAEIRALDAQGNLQITRQLELCLWVDEGEREITLRRFDRAPLTAFDLDGNPVQLDVRGDRVRLRIGTVPVRIRGFQSEPVCETSVEQWVARVDALLKRGNPTGQDAAVLKFNFDNALSVYRRTPMQGFGLVRTNWFEFERAYQSYRWIEAENARLHEFGTIRRDKAMSGGATLWLRTMMPIESVSATYNLALRETQTYTIWLAVRGAPTGTVEWQIVQPADTEAKPIAEGVALLSAERAVSRYADQCFWIPLGNAPLKSGDYQLRLRWKPDAQQPPHYAEWDVILVAPAGVQPKNVLPPIY
ncbi:MAG: hypothetical protein CFK49_00675 [Armatimonadetes bacterium JP3_11]|nr:MAG: hypothetical protein CFK49_00675 [Armatimonadetes bacterium JP3_11]RMH07920.1 MAG: hypothetical protein D6697_07520 [Armatimonadota bacterium]